MLINFELKKLKHRNFEKELNRMPKKTIKQITHKTQAKHTGKYDDTNKTKK